LYHDIIVEDGVHCDMQVGSFCSVFYHFWCIDMSDKLAILCCHWVTVFNFMSALSS
jgi:hypothetical protein